MKYDNQLRHAVIITQTFTGDQPLHLWLKDFFRQNHQMGSRDRKLLSTLVYGFYRLGHTVKTLPPEERILAGLFLCQDQPREFLHYFRPAWNEKVTLPLPEKIRFFQRQPEGAAFRVDEIFPWEDELSPAIDHEAFCLSFLRQPDLFLRIRPGFKTIVLEKLASFNIQFIPPFTLRLPNGFRIEDYFTPNHEIVIQDYSSQRIASFFPTSPTLANFWDACAASGGKSILAHDLCPQIKITASDIRESILHNLRARFQEAGIKNYTAFVADLTQPLPPDLRPERFDFVIVDAPCTGSGTWSRTPEELFFFDPNKILRYSGIQKKILSQIVPRLGPATWLVYSTCSVFKKENEEIAAFLRESLDLDQMENLKGYDQRADTLFAARFHRVNHP